MMKKIISIDFDGTISDTIVSVLEMLNRRYNKDFSLKDIKEYWYNHIYGISRDELNSAYAEVLMDDGGIDLVEPGIPEIIRGLGSEYDIYVVTYNTADGSRIERWLKEHGIVHKGVRVVKDKADFKDAELFIDDSPHSACELSERGKKVILLKKWYYAYGSEIDSANILPVESWGEIPAKVEQLIGSSSKNA